MKKNLVFLSFLVFSLGALAQTEVLLGNLDCSVFQVSASKDMSEANSPHNWQSVSKLNWQSTNVYAQTISEGNMTFLGKAVRFGSLKNGDGKATVSGIDLSKKKNEKVVIRLSVSSGADKSGALNILVDGKSLGQITAKTGADGKGFNRAYYNYEFEVKNGDKNSVITIEHSSTENKGYIYMNNFSVVKINN